MNVQKTLSWIILPPFLVLTAYAVYDVGVYGIFDYHLHSSAGWQVFTDLVIACILLLTFIVPDAKSKGVNPWPWVIGTFLTGSIAPLVYLIIYGGQKESA